MNKYLNNIDRLFLGCKLYGKDGIGCQAMFCCYQWCSGRDRLDGSGCQILCTSAINGAVGETDCDDGGCPMLSSAVSNGAVGETKPSFSIASFLPSSVNFSRNWDESTSLQIS